VPLKKTDMLVIRGGNESVDLDREIAPVFEEQLDGRHRQLAFDETAHEGSLGNAVLPTLNDFSVQSRYERFGVVRFHFDTELGD
jgi:hypothetical protein